MCLILLCKMSISAKKKREKNQDKTTSFTDKVYVCVFSFNKVLRLNQKHKKGKKMMIASGFYDYTSKNWIAECPLITVCRQTTVINICTEDVRLLKLMNAARWVFFSPPKIQLNVEWIFSQQIKDKPNNLSSFQRKAAKLKTGQTAFSE